MPRLDMSMHYYIAEPERRLVRINNSMLREGGWLAEGLQVVEITKDGATLDFVGVVFELRSANR